MAGWDDAWLKSHQAKIAPRKAPPQRVHKPVVVSRAAFGLDVPTGASKSRFAVSSKEDRTIDGETFDSKKEAARYCQLKNMQRAGMIEGLELQPTWVVEINGHRFCRYTADFAYHCKERGRLIYEDCKSSGTQKDDAYRLRKKAAQLAHGIQITEVIL